MTARKKPAADHKQQPTGTEPVQLQAVTTFQPVPKPTPHERQLKDLQDKLSYKTGEVLGLEASLSAWQSMLADEKAQHEKDVAALTEQNVGLMGDLRGAKAARERDVKTLRAELDALDIEKAQAEVVARQALADLAAANAKVKDLEQTRDDRRDAQLQERRSMESRLRDSQGETLRMTYRITELGSELDAAEDRIGHLERELAQARRGWIAKLLGRPAARRA
jgi:chromosome segregation ATPase